MKTKLSVMVVGRCHECVWWDILDCDRDSSMIRAARCRTLLGPPTEDRHARWLLTAPTDRCPAFEAWGDAREMVWRRGAEACSVIMHRVRGYIEALRDAAEAPREPGVLPTPLTAAAEHLYRAAAAELEGVLREAFVEAGLQPEQAPEGSVVDQPVEEERLR